MKPGDRVLVVEENPLVTHAIEHLPVELDRASDGWAAIELLETETYAAILIDGHSILRAVREKGMTVPTIFISGLPGEEPELKAFEIGAADFIHKPVKNQVLLARVAKVLGEPAK